MLRLTCTASLISVLLVACNKSDDSTGSSERERELQKRVEELEAELRDARAHEARRATKRFIAQLTMAADMYEKDWAVYPPGNGTDSKDLVKMLSRKGPKKLPYFEFAPEILTKDGNIKNPLYAGKPAPAGIIFYRNNMKLKDSNPTTPKVYNRRSIDIWCAGPGYPDIDDPAKAWGVNNWE